jgi:hypothetical protein
MELADVFPAILSEGNLDCFEHSPTPLISAMQSDQASSGGPLHYSTFYHSMIVRLSGLV